MQRHQLRFLNDWLNKTSQEFGIEKYSSVSSIVTKTEKQLAQNKQLRRRIDEIELKVNKGQALA